LTVALILKDSLTRLSRDPAALDETCRHALRSSGALLNSRAAKRPLCGA